MRRREFITLLGGVAVTQPFAAHAQQALPAIGFLHEGLPAPLSLTVAFQQGLIEGGISRGSSVKIENSSADGQYDQLPALAAELISHRVGIIVAAYLVAARAAEAATQTVPIVFITGSDPIAAGLVSSLNRPTSNATGVAFLFTRLGEKNLATLHELAPNAAVIGALVNRITLMQALRPVTCNKRPAPLDCSSSSLPPVAIRRLTASLPHSEKGKFKRCSLLPMGSFSVSRVSSPH